MRIIRTETLICCGEFATSDDWQRIRTDLHAAVRGVVWPPGSDTFTIYPQSGKKRGQGNGVKAIKEGLMIRLGHEGWSLEERLDITTLSQPGKLDAVLHTDYGPFAVEWETGNVSSSHRALEAVSKLSEGD